VPATQIEEAGHGLFWEIILQEAYADRDYFNIDHHRGGFAYVVTAAGGRVPWSLAVLLGLRPKPNQVVILRVGANTEGARGIAWSSPDTFHAALLEGFRRWILV
jgi:hypothetical protein